MANLLQTGSAWLEAQRHAHLTSSIVYTRGAESVALAATPGKSTFQMDIGSGPALQVESRDYLIRAVDLILGGVRVLPAPGDRISESDGASTWVFEVNAPGDAPCWRYSDAFRQTIRVHAKQVQP